MVKIEMMDGGVITLELDAKSAPITVANFEKLVKEGFYDGLIFHRVIAGFMIQGGDPTGTGMGGSEETIKGEFAINGVNNPIRHERGVISMARTQVPDSASSQFFICHADAFFLDGQYAAFGKVVDGIEVVDRIASVDTDFRDKPIVEQKIKTITIE
ncbi:MAG: peptidylprolyl isomerase [Clostridia bacterium]|nr:peptidylprolyl isomerase [Clostridia bacterium]